MPRLSNDPANPYDVLVVGGGQSGLAMAYYLRRLDVRYCVLDNQPMPGGAWRHGWDSLALFSPAAHNALPGWPMPKGDAPYPGRQAVVDYLAAYEKRYKLAVARPVTVREVTVEGPNFALSTNQGTLHAKAVVNATGTWHNPYIPDYPGRVHFSGAQAHSAHYQNPTPYKGQRVAIVGGGNSAAQILAEVSMVASVVWVTLAPSRFLPDEVDGRYLFSRATAVYKAKQAGEKTKPSGSLGDIVMVPSVKEARARGVLRHEPPFGHIDGHFLVWPDGRREAVDAIIWCTGFKPALGHLAGLGLVDGQGRVAVAGTQAANMPGLWLVGYGNWVGYASATVIGVGRSARQTAQAISAYLGGG